MKPTKIRWTIAVGLAAFAFCSYLTRSNISVAAETMIPVLGISKIQMGQIFSGFLWGYALFQIPGGVLGDRLGPRRTLALSALVWSIASVLTALTPILGGHNATIVYALIWVVRFTLGLSQATTFPVGNRAVHNWFAPSERASGGAIMFMGTSIASATTGALTPMLVADYGWKGSFYITAVPPLFLAVAWYLWSRDRPQQHPRVNEAEAAHIQAHDTPHSQVPSPTTSLFSLLSRRNVLLLILSYVSEGYVLFIFVFWLYIYLVEQRHLSAIRGGSAAAVPLLTALCMTPLGGRICDSIAKRQGRLAGTRTVLVISYSVTGLNCLVPPMLGPRCLRLSRSRFR